MVHTHRHRKSIATVFTPKEIAANTSPRLCAIRAPMAAVPPLRQFSPARMVRRCRTRTPVLSGQNGFSCDSNDRSRCAAIPITHSKVTFATTPIAAEVLTAGIDARRLRLPLRIVRRKRYCRRSANRPAAPPGIASGSSAWFQSGCGSTPADDSRRDRERRNAAFPSAQ